jgi:hypothetical protein
MRVSLEQQRELYREHAEAALEQLIALMRERGPELIELGEQRAFETVGLHEYGDSTYWIDDERLLAETLAELADAIFYHQIAIARETGALPSPPASPE